MMGTNCIDVPHQTPQCRPHAVGGCSQFLCNRSVLLKAEQFQHPKMQLQYISKTQFHSFRKKWFCLIRHTELSNTVKIGTIFPGLELSTLYFVHSNSLESYFLISYFSIGQLPLILHVPMPKISQCL